MKYTSFIWKWRWMLALCPVLFYSSAGAQVTINPIDSLCNGVVLYANELFTLDAGYKMDYIEDNFGNRYDNASDRITPASTTTYTLHYHQTANPSNTATVQTKVIIKTVPKYTVTIDNYSDFKNGKVCQEHEVRFKVVTHDGGGYPFYWSLDEGTPVMDNSPLHVINGKDIQKDFVVRVSATNLPCPTKDTSFKIYVFDKPTKENIIINWTHDFGAKETLCATCGFNIRQSGDIMSSEVPGDSIKIFDWAWDNAASSVIDTSEITLRPGLNPKRIKVMYTIERAGCLKSPLPDTVYVDVNIHATDCRIKAGGLNVKPCSSPVHLDLINSFFPKVSPGELPPCKLNDDVVLTNPDNTVWEIGEKTYYSAYPTESYRWPVRLSGTVDPTQTYSIGLKGTATLYCPYSTDSATVVRPYDLTVVPVVNSKYLTAAYNYCTGEKAVLELSLPTGVEFKEVDILDALPNSGASILAALFDGPNQVGPNKWTYTSKNPVNSGNRGSYQTIKVKAGYRLVDCSIDGEEEMPVNCRLKPDCSQATSSTSNCLGVDNYITMQGSGLIIDDIVVSDSGDLEIELGDNAFEYDDASGTGRLTFKTFYDIPLSQDNIKDTITVTARYHTADNPASASWDMEVPITVKACRPVLEYKQYENGCSCQGVHGSYRIRFDDYKGVYPDSCRINWMPEPYTPMWNAFNNRGQKEDVYSNANGRWEYVFRATYYNDTRIKGQVVYGIGSHTYTLDLTALKFTDDSQKGKLNTTGEEWVFQMEDEACRMQKIAQRDSCCVGDMIDFDIVNKNALASGLGKGYGRFVGLEWDESVREYIEEADRDMARRDQQQLTVNGNKAYGYHVRVKASPDGIYPFVIRDSVMSRRMSTDKAGKDTVILRYDTLRLYTLAAPVIFVEDTLYACTDSTIDLRDYVNWEAVDNIITPAVGDSWKIELHALSPFSATAELKYTCEDKTGNPTKLCTQEIWIKTDLPAQIRYVPDRIDKCPEDTDTLEVESAVGRLTWYKQIQYGNGYGAKTLLAENVSAAHRIPQEVTYDTILYTVMVQSMCPSNPTAYTTFKLKPKAKPFDSIHRVSSCGDDEVLLEVTTGAITGKPIWSYIDGRPIADPTKFTLPSTGGEATVVCKVIGQNGCTNTDTATLSSYPYPVSILQSSIDKNDAGIVCVEDNQSLTLSGRKTGSDIYDYSFNWYGDDLQAPSFTESGASFDRVYGEDTKVYLQTALLVENEARCPRLDSVIIYHYADNTRVTDSIGCKGSPFTYVLPYVEADVVYTWYRKVNAQTESEMCSGCDHRDFLNGDFEGEYRISMNRKGCVNSAVFNLSYYDDPKLGLTVVDNAEGRYCEGENIVLRSQTESETVRLDSLTYPDGTAYGVPAAQHTWVFEAGRDKAGTYTVTSVINGCVYEAQAEVKIDTLPARIYFDTLAASYCEGETITVRVIPDIPGYEYKWYLKGNETETGAVYTLSDLTPEHSGELKFRLKNGVCEAYSETQNLMVIATPQVAFSYEGGRTEDDKLYFCEGDDFVLRLTGALSTDSIVWYFNGNAVSHTGNDWRFTGLDKNEKGTYEAGVIRLGCPSNKPAFGMDIREVPELEALSDTSICEESSLHLDVWDSRYPNARYDWLELGVQDYKVELKQAGTYTVVINVGGCTDTATVQVSVRPLPRWEFPNDTSICERDSVIVCCPLEGEEYSLRWDNGSTENCIVINREGSYTLTVTKAGCSYSEVYNLFNQFCTPIFFATAFSPSSSMRENRFFGPITVAKNEDLIYTLYIFNALGELMFKTSDVEEGWDGTFKGQPAPAGMYYYRCVAKVREDGRDLSRTGTVKLIR